MSLYPKGIFFYESLLYENNAHGCSFSQWAQISSFSLGSRMMKCIWFVTCMLVHDYNWYENVPWGRLLFLRKFISKETYFYTLSKTVKEIRRQVIKRIAPWLSNVVMEKGLRVGPALSCIWSYLTYSAPVHPHSMDKEDIS